MTRRAVARMTAVVAFVALFGLPTQAAQSLVEQSSQTCSLDPLPDGFEDLGKFVGLDVDAAVDALGSDSRIEVTVTPEERPAVDPVVVWRIGVVRLDYEERTLVLNDGHEIVICAGTAVPDTIESALDEASSRLEERTLVPTRLPPAAEDVWTVESSEPAVGTPVAFGTEVTLTAVQPSVDPDPNPDPPVIDPRPTPDVPAATSEPAPRTETPEPAPLPAPRQSPSSTTRGGTRAGPSESTTPLGNRDPFVPPAAGIALGAAVVGAWAVAAALARARSRTPGSEREPGDLARSVSVRVVGGQQALDLLELPAVRRGRSLRIHLRPGQAVEGDRTRLHDHTENDGGRHG